MIHAPLPLRPELRRRIWGGDRLSTWVDGDVEPGEAPVGEAWLLGPDSVVSAGPHGGSRLADLAAEAGEALLGRASVARYGHAVPLLAKLLDAADELSIQVHPDDAYALEHHPGSGHLGKTESWLVLEAAPHARIRWGFQRAVEPAEVRDAARGGTLEALLREVPVAAGDVIHNPAGTVHGLGPGLMVFELQQASDLTYRLYDFGRVGADGRPRELHLDHALTVADLSGEGEPHLAPGATDSGWTRLVSCPNYLLDRAELNGTLAGATEPASLQTLTVLSGELEVAAGGERLPLAAGASALLPAALGAYLLEGEAVVVRGRLPG